MYFQVAADKQTKQQEETKIDTKSIDVDTNISFRPNRERGNKGQQQQQQAPKKPKVNHEEIEKTLKDIYKLTNGEELEDRESPEEETKKLANKVSGKETLYTFFRTFYDGRLDAIRKRLFVPNLLLDSSFITEDEFLDMYACPSICVF